MNYYEKFRVCVRRERAGGGKGGSSNCRGGKKTRSISILIQVFSSSSLLKEIKEKDTHGTHTHTQIIIDYALVLLLFIKYISVFILFLFNFCFGIS